MFSSSALDAREGLEFMRGVPGFDESSPPQNMRGYRVMDRDGMEYSLIREYLANGNPHDMSLEVAEVLKVTNNSFFLEGNFFQIQQPGIKPSYTMLWHGTNARNVIPILKDGFQKPEPKGQMFGTGAYFSDRASKSAQYCDPRMPLLSASRYLLVCAVKTENFLIAAKADHGIRSIEGYDCIKGVGRLTPDPSKDKIFGKCTWPIGKTENGHVDCHEKTENLKYNEYAVYDMTNVEVIYLVKVQNGVPLCVIM